MRLKMIAMSLVSLLALACSHGHGLRDRHPHAPRDIETYIARLESPERLALLQVDRVLGTLGLSKTDTVADIGSGPGIFAIPLGRRLSSGLIYAVDVEPKQLDALRMRVAAAGLTNVVPVLGGFEDPFLPANRLDLVLVVDTYHHIEDRARYFERLRRVFRDGGRLAIVEWASGPPGMGPPPEYRLAEGQLEAELRAAGYERVASFGFLELLPAHPLRDIFDLCFVQGGPFPVQGRFRLG
jgi:SAM-dependent methyltransferase